jgi:hypothetical protein
MDDFAGIFMVVIRFRMGKYRKHAENIAIFDGKRWGEVHAAYRLHISAKILTKNEINDIIKMYELLFVRRKYMNI